MTECKLFGGPENLIDVATLLAATRNPPWLTILVNVHDYISAGLGGDTTRIMLPMQSDSLVAPLDDTGPSWSVTFVTIVPDYGARPGRLVAY